MEIEQKFKYLKCSDLFILQKRFPSEIVFKIRKNAENEKFYFFEEIFRLEEKIAPCVIHCTYTRTSIKISIFRFRYIFLYVRIILWVSIYMCVCVCVCFSPFLFLFFLFLRMQAKHRYVYQEPLKIRSNSGSGEEKYCPHYVFRPVIF